MSGWPRKWKGCITTSLKSHHKGALLESSTSDFYLVSVEGVCPFFQRFGHVIVNLEKARSHFPQHSNSRHHIMLSDII